MATLARSNVAAKVVLAAMLAHAVLFPDLPQYVGKGIGYRLALYPLAALLVPLVWRLAVVPHRPDLPYPHHLDLCVTLPFLLDTAGNTANLFDRITWWDDVMHVVNWVPWVVAFGFVLRYVPSLGRWATAGLVVGFGAVTHIVWELGEYLTFVQDNPGEAMSAYRDTIGDLVMSLLGSFVGATLVATLLWDIAPRPAVEQPAPA